MTRIGRPHPCVAKARRTPPDSVLLALAILVSLAAGSAWSGEGTEHPADDPLVLSGGLETRRQLVDGWRYHPGDDPSWSDPQLDDHGWVVASSLLRIGEDPPGGWSGIGWFRRRLVLADDMPPTALAIRVEHLGASEVYVDGRLVTKVGTVSSDPQIERPAYANDFSGVALVPGQVHVLAVRYSNSRGNLLGGTIRGFGFNLRSVESAAASYHRWSRTTMTAPMAFAGAFAALAFLHLLLFAFHRASREHIFFALFAALTTTGLVLEVSLALQTDLIARLQTFKLAVAVAVAAVLAGLMLVNVLFQRRHRWTTWALAAAGVAVLAHVSSWDAFRSGTSIRIFFVLAFLEMLRVSAAALFRREPDAWIVAAAFTLMAVITLTQAAARFVGRPLQSPLVADAALVIVALAFSFFISRRAARTARELERRLAEVRELSERAVEQERRAIQEETERRLLESEHRRRSEELDAARRLQLAMLPRAAPEIPGLDLAYRMLTATEVGGDYVDMKIGEGGRMLLAVGDATSHGLQAGMVVAVAKSLFQGVDPADSPADVLARIGAGLQALRERHAGMAMVVVVVHHGRLQIASAGMPPVLVRRGRSATVEEVMLPGVPLGTLANPEYTVHEIEVVRNDIVLMMSDGVVEAVGPTGEPFGYDRVAEHLRRCEPGAAEEIVEVLLDTVTTYAGASPPHDDITVLALVVT